MTGRQRVRAAFEHREPDRTPIFEKLIKRPHVAAILGRPCVLNDWPATMERLDAGDWEGMVEQTARDIVDLAQTLGMDMVRIRINQPRDAPRPKRVGERAWQEGEVISELLDTGWVRQRSLAPPDTRSEEELARDTEAWAEESPPSDPDPTEYAVMRRTRELMAERGLDLGLSACMYTMAVATLSRIQLEWLHTRPALMRRFYRRCADNAIAEMRRVLELKPDLMGLGGDLACDHGPLISPATYREFIMPEPRRQADFAHQCGCFATNASDGDIRPLLDDFLIGAGVDGLEEIDYVAGMRIGQLKQRYGDRITFIGNLDIRFLLTRGTPEQCRQHTFEILEEGKGSGGHLLMSSNCIHEDVKLENFLACLEAYRDYFGLS